MLLLKYDIIVCSALKKGDYMKNEHDLLCKINNYLFLTEIEKSNLDLQSLNLKLKNCLLEYLCDNKPYFFQKKNKENHNKKVQILKEKIADCYKKIDDELELINKFSD